MNALDLLKSMVAIPSVNPFQYFDAKPTSGVASSGYVGLGAEVQMNLFIEEHLKKCGFEVTRQELHPQSSILVNGRIVEVPARWNLLGTLPPRGKGNGKSILFLGHTDTVDVKQGWESDPFTINARVVDGQERWFGLGANDMKGGLAAILHAVQLAHSSHYTIKVAFVVDEEFYSFGADLLCHSSFLDDVAIAIAPEIGDSPSLPSSLNASCQWLGLGRLGRMEYEFQVEGKACHGADVFVREDSVNAVLEAAKLEVALGEDCTQLRRRYSAHGVDTMNSAFLSYHLGGEAMLSVPDKAQFILDRTLLPDESTDGELKRLQTFVRSLQETGKVDPRARISVAQKARPTSPCQPYFFSPSIPEISRFIDITKRHVNEISFGIGRSVADENRVAARGIPTITLGPSGAGSHTCQEWVDPASIVRVAEIFKSIIADS